MRARSHQQALFVLKGQHVEVEFVGVTGLRTQRVVAVPRRTLRTPHLGMDEMNSYQTLCQRIDRVFHCGTSNETIGHLRVRREPRRNVALPESF